MIPKIYKLQLRKIADFFQTSRRFYSKYFLVFYRNCESETSQMVVVTPKKSFKLRVKRSQVKRLVYGLFFPLFKETTNLELVLVVNKKIFMANRTEISADLEKLLIGINRK